MRVENIETNREECSENTESQGKMAGRNFSCGPVKEDKEDEASIGGFIIDIVKMIIAGLVISFTTSKCESDWKGDNKEEEDDDVEES